MKRLLFLTTLLLVINISYSQTGNNRILKSNSEVLDIKDNGILKKKSWTILPEVKPDIYVTSNINKSVTFYSDIDSISFNIEPNKKIQFNVVLNNKDTALTEIVYQRPFIDILKSASKYDVGREQKELDFSYQSKNNRHLKSLRRKFKLDSIAGNGGEISKLINLMNWLHNKVPHNGSNGNPKSKNAKAMLSICEKENRGLNCRGLAIVYNECCLSLGFQSRYVTCLPKDSLKIDRDCHVINSIFVNELDKWIWFDPTFNAYVMDENDNLLGIQEVRERLINNKPLKINSDANWNNKNKTDINHYLYKYMAKNLYVLECPLESKYNIESNFTWKAITNKVNFVKLIPEDYNNNFSNFVHKVSTNPDVFWAKPQ